METRANYMLIGGFVIAGFVALLAFLMWFARFEVDRQFEYYDIHFPEVSGLGVASGVRFAGLPVGQVVDMGLSPSGDGTVRVRVEVRQGTPIRTDSQATLEMQGVTGVANIAITAGTPTAPLLRAETSGIPVIPAARSTLQALGEDAPQIIERLVEVSDRLSHILGDDNQRRIEAILQNVENSTANMDQALADVSHATAAVSSVAAGMQGFGDQMQELSASAQDTLNSATAALDKVTETAGGLDQTLASGTQVLDTVNTYVAGDLAALTRNLDAAAQSIQGDLSTLTARLAQTLDGTDAALTSATRAFDGADRMLNTDIGPVIGDLRQSLATLNTAVEQVSADIPAITGQLRDAASSAEGAFASLRRMVDGAQAPLQSFLGDGLTQFGQAGRDIRALVQNMDALVTTLRRNPSQVLTGPRQPEFRR
ncbi:MlaD family protein [Paracoccus sp. (in: a-proteobacteria)]|uniref:MlaD family protein n=1 Tax=Paracoccus sp. TaxID=267 RepID=UPI0026DFB64A|nr:MlaD family protein [Paracoccus sp. (in: a-proteobacteria)]MDO5646825.1 MlaD family protein [Paracoccus sp. (in: a-proteobacteria)]